MGRVELEVHTFGRGVALSRRQDGTTAKMFCTVKKAFAVLYLLTSSHSKSLPLSQFHETLWSWMDEKSFSSNFFTNLNIIRKQLLLQPEEIFVRNNVCYLNVDKLYIDTEEFERVVSKLTEVPMFEKQKYIERAYELYKGHFLEDYPDDEWVIPIRENYREKFTVVLDEHMRLALHQTDFMKAVEIAEKAIRLDRYDETAYFCLCLAYQNLGKIGTAKRYYERAQKIFIRELGVGLSFNFNDVVKARSLLVPHFVRRDGSSRALFVTEEVLKRYLRNSKQVLVMKISIDSVQDIKPETLVQLFRPGDILSMKGKDLNVILSGIEKENAQKVAERISERIQRHLSGKGFFDRVEIFRLKEFSLQIQHLRQLSL